MNKLILSLTSIALFCSMKTYAHDPVPVVIAERSIISEIGNTTGNYRNFFIRVEGGSTSCSVVIFPLEDAGEAGNDENIHARAYSAALTAFTNRKKVIITSYTNSGCDNASKIKLVY